MFFCKRSADYIKIFKELHKIPLAALKGMHYLLSSYNQSGWDHREIFPMFEGIVSLRSLRVRNVMVPRSKMVVLDKDMTFHETVKVIIKSGHSRFPVISDGLDDVKGIFFAKELLNTSISPNPDEFDIENYMRPALTVPESRGLQMILSDFRKSRYHMAVVVDEYSGVSGLVTIEDVLEQIVGNILDEYDDADTNYFFSNHGEGAYLIDGEMPIDIFDQYFGTNLSGFRANTLAGVVIKHCKHMPKTGETFELGGKIFTVKEAGKRRIRKIMVSKPKHLNSREKPTQ